MSWGIAVRCPLLHCYYLVSAQNDREFMDDHPTSFVLPFESIAADHASLVGGKGFHLAELARAGLPVLPGFCITTDAYRAFVRTNGLTHAVESGDASAIIAGLLNAPLPDAIGGAICAAYEALGGAVAVRSSATAEDLQSASFAGQYATYLNVSGTDAVLDRVRACWASMWSEAALDYLRRNDADPRQAAMGVVVQRQGRAEASGVVFTVNPLTGDENQMVIEAAWGLGEAVVSGRVTPDRYTVDIRRGVVTDRRVANQSVILVADVTGGVREEPLPDQQRDQAVLADNKLLELARLADEVAVLYGHPQDVEWALVDGGFILLQARPMTAIHFDPAIGQWTSANYREVLPGFACPLTFSLSLGLGMEHAMRWFFKTIKMGVVPDDVPIAWTYFGRIYWNVGVVKQMAAKVPGFSERQFDATVGIEPTYQGDGSKTPWSIPVILRALPILFGLNEQFDKEWQRARDFRDHYYANAEPELRTRDVRALDDAALAAHCRRMAGLHGDGNFHALVITFLAEQAQEDFEQAVHKLDKRLPEHDHLTMGDLITGLDAVATARPPHALGHLAKKALADPQARQAISGGPPESLLDRLGDHPLRREIEETIAQFHYMAAIDEDLIQPRWDEDPTDALVSLYHFVQAGDQFDPEGHVAEQRQKRERAEGLARRALASGLGKFWPFDRRAFFEKLELVRRYVWWREETRVVMSHIFYHCRRAFRELGQRWQGAGQIDQADHIFLLGWPAIRTVLDGETLTDSLRQQVSNYQRLKARFRNYDPPGVIGRGSSLHRIERKPGQQTYRGVACSSGVVEGQARVARTLDEARALEQGEILVARYTNPGWTPLFAVAGGIVIEEGGLLSHGAVVAREYGIPAVLSIEGATQLIQTGQRLRLDGAAGTVEII